MTSSSSLNVAVNHQDSSCSCECAEAIVELQKTIAALKKQVNNLERNATGNLYTWFEFLLLGLHNKCVLS